MSLIRPLHASGPHGTARLAPPSPVPLSPIERLPKWLLCVPLVAHWMLLAVRHRSLTLPSAANPGIHTGGLAGEGKLECLDLIPLELREFVAPTAAVAPGEDAEAARQAAGLRFPLVAKPDRGWCGHGVRRINDAAALRAYQAAFPRDGTFLLQSWHPGPVEAGLTVRRWPDGPDDQPALAGITLRHAPMVLGDGRRTLAELAAADPRLGTVALAAHDPARVPRAGEAVPLTTVASLRVGARYEDAAHLATPALQGRVSAIAAGMGLRAGTAGRAGGVAAGAAGRAVHHHRGEWRRGGGNPCLGSAAGAVGGVRGRVRQPSRAVRGGCGDARTGHRPVGPWRLSAAWLRQQRLARGYPASN